MATRKPLYRGADGRLVEMGLSDEIPTGNLPELTELAVPATTVIAGAWPGDIIRFDGTVWRNEPLSFGSPGAAGSECFYCASPTLLAKSAENGFPILSLASAPVTTGELELSVTLSPDSSVILAAWKSTAALNRSSLPGGIWTPLIFCGTDNATGVTWDTRSVAEIVGSGAITLTTTGSGTSRTVTASASFFSSGDAATNWLETPKGLYPITAYSSPTVVTIAVPVGYSNEVAVVGARWKILFSTYSIDINAISPTEMPLGWDSMQNTFTVQAASKLGVIDQVANSGGTGSITVTMTYNGGVDFTQHSRLYSTIPIGDGQGTLATAKGFAILVTNIFS
ncbi:MAG: hypothetical protein HQL90_14500 [Magnetococcales bacterium]|nr:hypothetical protein [Magnetococcales bacterium]